MCDFCCVFCNPCLLFFFIFVKKKVQQVLYIGFLLDRFHKEGVWFFLRCVRRIGILPFFQQIVVIGQYAITPRPGPPKRWGLGFGGRTHLRGGGRAYKKKKTTPAPRPGGGRGGGGGGGGGGGPPRGGAPPEGKKKYSLFNFMLGFLSS